MNGCTETTRLLLDRGSDIIAYIALQFLPGMFSYQTKVVHLWRGRNHRSSANIEQKPNSFLSWKRCLAYISIIEMSKMLNDNFT